MNGAFVSVCTHMFRVLLVCYPYVSPMLLVVLMGCFSHDQFRTAQSDDRFVRETRVTV